MQPIYIDDTIEVVITVETLRDRSGIATISTIVKKKETGDVCVKGEATIMKGENLRA